MFDVIRKAEYFDCLDRGLAPRNDMSLKGIQDGWTLSQLCDVKGKRMLEVGGGNSSVLPQLEGNKLWNVDRFEGVGQGPTKVPTQRGIEVIRAFMGDFSPLLPEVDIVFSISVIEHIPFESYVDTFADMARCLPSGGVMIHTVDLPLADVALTHSDTRLRLLREAVEQAGLRWREVPSIGPGATFEADMASNSDLSTWQWTKISEATKLSGPLYQLVSIKMIAEKP